MELKEAIKPITITAHAVEGSQSDTVIVVRDEAGQGGAHHEYDVQTTAYERVPAGDGVHADLCCKHLGRISFQNGPIKEFGHNGVQGEHLLAIVSHRLQCFQAGPFASAYNAEALEHVQAALNALLQRTRDRMARGVEGVNKA